MAEWFSIIADAAEFHRFEPGGFEFVSQGDTVVVLGSVGDLKLARRGISCLS